MGKVIKSLIIGLTTVVTLLGGVAVSGCAEKSTAVTRDELYRADFSKEQEEKDDEKGREHIEIPADATTMEIDGEEWIVVRKITDLTSNSFKKNFIQANDVDLEQYDGLEITFTGKYNGNNYKFYGKQWTPLFYQTKNAIIENIIFSSKAEYALGRYDAKVLIAGGAENSTIKNCINYCSNFDFNGGRDTRFNGLIGTTRNSHIEKIINYGDIKNVAGGAICRAAINGTVVSDCKNYGNLIETVHGDRFPVGGIVGESYEGDCIITDCENYGDIAGTSYMGGILGCTLCEYAGLSDVYNDEYQITDEKHYVKNVVINNCKNYGNLYLVKENGNSKLESTENTWNSYVYGIGGLAGSVEKIEESENYGEFYGFESLGKGIKVDYSGGIVGVAKEVINCTSETTIKVQKGRALHVGQIYGYLVK